MLVRLWLIGPTTEAKIPCADPYNRNFNKIYTQEEGTSAIEALLATLGVGSEYTDPMGEMYVKKSDGSWKSP